jgi:hypothetical protein
MELVLKLPKGKPPFIGIEFPNEFNGQRANTDLVNNYKESKYRLLLEPTEKGLTITLSSHDLATPRVYKNIGFNAGKLKNWLNYVGGAPHINFGHVYIEHNAHKIVFVFGTRRNFVLKVTNIEITAKDSIFSENAFRVSNRNDW